MSLRLLLLLAFDRFMWAFEVLAEVVISRMPPGLWRAIEDERPVWPELALWLLR